MKDQHSASLPFGRFLTTVTAVLMTLGVAHADYQSTVLNDHPLAYYPINSSVDPTGATATDLSGNGNNGTYVSNDPQFNSVPGPTPYLPNALAFDGLDSYVDLSTGNNPALLNFNGTITMEAWVQPANTTESPADILGKGYDGTYEVTLRANGGNYYGGFYGPAGQFSVAGGSQTTNWAYVVSTYDGTNWNIYQNGNLVQTNAASFGVTNFATPWAIGVGTPISGGRWFQGNICQVAIYTNALLPSQIYAHYFAGQYGLSPSNSVPIITSQPTPQVSYAGGGATFNVSVLSVLAITNQWYKGGSPITGQTNLTLVLTNLQPSDAVNYSVVIGNSNGTTNSVSASLTLSLPAPTAYESTVLNDQPIAYLPLESSVDTATTAYDWSGNGNNGTYNNSSSYNSGNSPAPHISNSANFNGSLSATLGGQNAGLLNFGGKITLEAWVQPANVTGNLQDILAKGYNSSSYNETVLRQDSATYTGNGGSGGVAQVGTWAYVVSANDGTNWNLYVNGLLVKQSSSSSGANNFSDPWAIGSGTSGGSFRYLSGNLSQVALYNHGLSANQVLAHYLIAESGTSNVRPIITSEPLSQTGWIGGNITFSVSAVSLSAITNQWLWNGTPLTGQTNAILTLTNLSAGNAGNYTVVVGNNYGTTNSTAAALTINVPNNLAWSANNNNGIWDTATTANWSNLTTSVQTVFNTGDAVTFDDTVGVPTTVTLGVGSTVQPSLITVNSSVNNFTIQRAGDLSGILNGSGNLLKKGTSTLTINTGGTLTGTATIAGGVVYAGNNSFANLSAITITNNSTLDIGGSSFNTPVPVTISDSGFNGEGAIINSYGDVYNVAFNINLAGDATITAGPHRWDLVSGSVTGAHTLTVNGNGNYSMEWNATSIGANVSSVVFTNGEFGIKSLGSSFQNPATAFVVSPNVKFDFWSAGDNGYNGSLILMSGAAPVNVFTGIPLTIGNGATLSYANNTINGDLVIGAGATASSSGAATGSLGVSGNVTLNGTTVIRLNGSGNNDTISAGQSITYGGTLNLVNIGATLAVGNSFPIFKSTNSTYSGSFTYSPLTPGAGLAWQLSGGTLSVVAAGATGPVVNSTKVINGNLVLGGSGGASGGTYYVLTTTNLTSPLANWTVASTNLYDSSGNFTVTNAITAGVPQQFYRIKQ
jgi:Concanavalin A-like lectin/glucanases superfamily